MFAPSANPGTASNDGDRGSHRDPIRDAPSWRRPGRWAAADDDGPCERHPASWARYAGRSPDETTAPWWC